MASTMFMRVDEVAEELGVSVPCAFPPAQRRVEKFRRGAGRPFQRAALLGEATAVAGGKAPAPPRRAHDTLQPEGMKVS